MTEPLFTAEQEARIRELVRDEHEAMWREAKAMLAAADQERAEAADKGEVGE